MTEDQRQMTKDQKIKIQEGKKQWLRVRSAIRLFMLFCLLLSVIGLWSKCAQAQDKTFEADVNATTVELGSYVRLTLTATGANGLDPVELPKIDGFDIDFIGPSSRVSIVNGKYFSSYALLYNLYPMKLGQFEIPSITTKIDGKEYSTEPIMIKVVDRTAGGDASQQGQAAAQSLQERIFVLLEAQKEQAYVHSKVPVFIRLFISGISVRNVEMPAIDHEGFLMGDFDEPQQYTQLINGTRYNVVEFKTSLYPVQVGELKLGPAALRCNVLFKDNSRAKGSRGFFDDDLFDGFFNSYQVRPVALESKTAVVDVKPLPQEGKPEDFSGAVGKFSFNMEVSPQQVKVGDPITVRMKVSGEGSLDTFDLKGFKSDEHFKAYEPEVHKEGKAKILEQVLIPQNEHVAEIPEVNFSFFDVKQARYRTIAWGPVSLEVSPVAKGQEFAVVGGQNQADNMFVRKDKLGKGINFIQQRLGHLYPKGYRAYRMPWFIGLVAVIILGWICGVVYYQFLYKLKTDVRFAKRLQAPQYARVGLKKAKVLLNKNEAAAFYDELFITLQKYFEHKCHIAPGTVSANMIRDELARRGKQLDIIEKVEKVFAECEAVRYASAGFGRDDMARSYEIAQEVIDWFERKF